MNRVTLAARIKRRLMQWHQTIGVVTMAKNIIKELRGRWHNDITADIVRDREYSEIIYYRNLMSYNANQMLVSQGTAEKTAEYRYFAAVHKTAAFAHACG